MNVQRMASESASSFDGRVRSHLRDMTASAGVVVTRDAGTVYAEGVHAGLSIALAAVQRRERILDYLVRWETEARRRLEREQA